MPTISILPLSVGSLTSAWLWIWILRIVTNEGVLKDHSSTIVLEWLKHVIYYCFNGCKVCLQAGKGRNRLINLVIHYQFLVEKCLARLQGLDQGVIQAAGLHNFILNKLRLRERPHIHLLASYVFRSLDQKRLNHSVRLLGLSLQNICYHDSVPQYLLRSVLFALGHLQDPLENFLRRVLFWHYLS